MRALARAMMIGAALSCAVAVPVRADEPLKVAAHVDKTEVPVGGILMYSVSIAGAAVRPPAVLASFEGFKIVSQAQSESVQVHSGKTATLLTLRYALMPTASGKQVLGSVRVEYQGKTYKTNPIEITVLPGQAPAEPSEKSSPDRGAPRIEGGVTL